MNTSIISWIWRNMKLTCNEFCVFDRTVMLTYCIGLTELKVFFCSFSFVLRTWCFSLQFPKLVGQNWWVPVAQIPLFHHCNVLVKHFTMFIIDFTKISREEVKVWIQKMYLQQHIACHDILFLKYVVSQLDVDWCSVIAKKILKNILECLTYHFLRPH